MNYGILNFKAQNGKPGIFWANEQSKGTTKKNFGYKKREQKFSIRQHPHNYDRIETEENAENIEQEKAKKPAKNFIQRNREKLSKKGKKEYDQTANGTVTLTQEQLNAILASVGKVASGGEDKLRISIDADSSAITIESPRGRHGDYEGENEKHDRDRKEKEKSESKDRKAGKKKTKKEGSEQISIFDLLKPRKSSRDEEKSEERKKIDDEKRSKRESDDRRDDSEERGVRHRHDSDDVNKYTSRKTDKRSKHSRDRNQSRDRDHSRERWHSRERNRSRDREKDYSPPSTHERSRNKGRHRNDSDRQSRELTSEDDWRKKDSEKKKRKDKHRENERNRESEREEKDNNDRGDNPEVLSPREVVGLPVTLPWKHMTVAERRRLMLARETAQAEQEKKEEELTKEYWKKAKKDMAESQGKRKLKKEERSSRPQDHSRERSRERSKEKSRERSRERSKEKSRERSRERLLNRSQERSRGTRDHSQERSHERSRDRRPRSRTPSPDNRKDQRSTTTADSLPPPAAPRSLTLAEKKRLQWEKERVESKLEDIYTPWGKPGAGAPIRTKSGKISVDYRGRQYEDHYPVIDEENDDSGHKDKGKTTTTTSRDDQHDHGNRSKYDQSKELHREESKPNKDESNYVQVQTNVPAAMRSSFIFGHVAPDADMYENTKEQERRQWLKELEQQREEKRLQQMKKLENPESSQTTWADKFSSDYRPAGLPEQPPETLRKDEYHAQVDTGRVSSAPVNTEATGGEETTYIRGQNVFIDPLTKRELEDKRQRQMEHQRAIMEQVQEKQRLKQMERDRKLKEELEEERKLQAERDRLQRQFELEQNKTKMKEARRQEEVERLKAAMDEAHERAMREKYSRRMQHLEQGGHDISHLKANLAAKLTPRDNVGGVPAPYVPGLNLETSPRTVVPVAQLSHKEAYHEAYTENRILTPSQFRRPYDHSPKREFGTQTEFGTGIEEGTRRESTEVNIMYKFVNGKRVRVKSAPREERYQRQEVPKKKKPEKAKGKKLWNYQNKKMTKPVKQSERDPFYEQKTTESRMRRQKREQELLQLVEKNKNLIPTERPNRTPGHSRDASPHSDYGHSPRSVNKQSVTRRSRSYSPDHVSESRSQTRTLDVQNPPSVRGRSPGTRRSLSPQVPSHRSRSPPVPAIRHRFQTSEKTGGAEILQLDHGYGPTTKVSHEKYADGDPLEIPLGDSEFVPFTRTVDILDPAEAGVALPMSREATKIANARKSYLKGLNPGNYGKKIDMYEDRIRMPNEPKDNNPITNPSLVKDHPTQRQDMILQQLSTLKESLMQRQRELETFSPTDFE